MGILNTLISGVLHPLTESGLFAITKVSLTDDKLVIEMRPQRVEIINGDEHYHADATFILSSNPKEAEVFVDIKTKSNLHGQFFAVNITSLAYFFTGLTNQGVTLKGKRLGEEFQIRVSNVNISLREQSHLILKVLAVQEDFKAQVNSEEKVVITLV